MITDDRYWCHICNITSPIDIGDDGEKKCRRCNSPFIELIVSNNYNRSNFIITSNPSPATNALIEAIRIMEDRAIMEMRQESNLEEVTNQSFNESLGNQSEQPISNEYFSSLKEIFLSSKDLSVECLICKTDFKEELKGLKLECGHIFHKECISLWFNKNNTCPTCRYIFPVKG